MSNCNNLDIMNKLPKISIIIPVYNVEEYIAECIQSVMKQTYKGEIECILVNDCGKDRSVEVAEQLIEEWRLENNDCKLTFSIVHHERNRGLSAARNTGTEVATGDYIYYLDSDDYIPDHCVQTLTEPLMNMHYDMVMGDMQTFGDVNNIKYQLDELDEIVGNEAIFTAYANRQIHVMACNKLYKKSFLKDNRITFLEGQLHEDEMWTYKVMCCIDSIAICRSTTYLYRMRGGSIIKTDNIANGRKADAYFETFKYMVQHPYRYKDLYEMVIACYAKMYLNLAFASHKPFYAQYKFVRANYSGSEIVRKKGIKAHLNMPIPIGYCYAKIWSGIKRLVSTN